MIARQPLQRRVLAVIAAAASVTSACGADGPDGSDVSTDATVSLAEPPTAVVESGVGVVAEGCSLVANLGSGVVVESSGRVATAAHTVRGATQVSVVDAAGRSHDATVVAFDKDADLALLDVSTLTAPALAIGTAAPGSARLVSWRRSDGVTETPVQVTRLLDITIEDIYVEEIVTRSGLEVSASVTIGQSGAPVIDSDGQVVGIVYAASKERPSIGFATDDRELRELLSARSRDAVDNGRCP